MFIIGRFGLLQHEIKEDVRKYAEHGVAEQDALQMGMAEKSREFTEKAASFT